MRYFTLMTLFLFFGLVLGQPSLSFAKKKVTQEKTAATKTQIIATNNSLQDRINNLSKDDQRLFDALSQDQKNKISQGQIDLGFNAWMVKLALGQPLYGTEHHPIYVDYEEVWLYTKPDVKKTVKEETIIDKQTNWPTVHRQITSKTCQISDFFVLWDRGVVVAIHPVTDNKVNGSCTIIKEEAFLPIVDGKPVEPK